jgi:hypothetical protein
VGTGPFLAPGEARDLVLDCTLQQRVPGRVELHLVDAVAVAVVRFEDRQVAFGPAAVLERLETAGPAADLARALDSPASPFALERLLERAVDLKQIDRLQRRGLVEDRASGGDLRAGLISGDKRSRAAVLSERLRRLVDRYRLHVNRDSHGSAR